jgi:hypothetical protein
VTKPEISGIAPFFIIKNVPAALRFIAIASASITFKAREDDIFFGIIQRERR